MKIGILTYHRSKNYGAILQCYALQEYLRRNGHDVKVIDIINRKRGIIFRTLDNGKNIILRFIKSPKVFIKSFQFFSIYDLIAILKKLQKVKSHKANFNKFLKNRLILTEQYNFDNLNHSFNEFDAIVVGSDQIWNTSSLRKHKSQFFFSKLEQFNGLRISYAACRGVNDMPLKDIDLFKSALHSFNYISVRDQQTKQFVKNLIGNDVQIVCDPTMLHDFSEIIQEKNNVNNYIISYIIGKEIIGGHKRVLSELRKRYPNTKVVSIVLTKKHPKYFKWADDIIYDCSPEKWIELFKNAKFIYTDSFHGVIFATKFKRPFLCYYTEKKRASRLIDFVNRYSLANCIISSYSEAMIKQVFDNNIEYSLYDIEKRKIIEESKRFLFNALKQ